MCRLHLCNLLLPKPSCFLYDLSLSLVFFYLCIVLFSGILQFNGYFVDGQSISKYRNLAPLKGCKSSVLPTHTPTLGYLAKILTCYRHVGAQRCCPLIKFFFMHRENLEDLQQIVAQLENDRFIASRRAQRLEEELKSQEKVRRKIWL